MFKNKYKEIFFFGHFINPFIILTTICVYQIYRQSLNNFENSGIAIFAGFILVAMLAGLIRLKLDRQFFKNPVEIFWNKSMPRYIELKSKVFVFDEKNVNKAEFWVLTILFSSLPIFFGTVIGSADTDHVFVIILFVLSLILNSIFLVPACRQYIKFKNEGRPRGFAESYSYVIHYRREQHYFDSSMSIITKPKVYKIFVVCILYILLSADYIFHTGYLYLFITKVSDPQKIKYAGEVFNFFISIGLWLAIMNVSRYFYIDGLLKELGFQK